MSGHKADQLRSTNEWERKCYAVGGAPASRLVKVKVTRSLAISRKTIRTISVDVQAKLSLRPLKFNRVGSFRYLEEFWQAETLLAIDPKQGVIGDRQAIIVLNC
jgi:hypothetical protein